MSTTIQIKRSSTASAVPLSGDLAVGELAVNLADKRLFAKQADGTIIELSTNPTDLDAATLRIDGVEITASATELNSLDGLTATTAELNILDGVTATATEINKLDGFTGSTAELNLLDGVTATTAELNFVDGVTSNIQTQLNAKQPLDAQLTDIAGLTPTDGSFIVGNGVNFVAESGNTAIASLGVTATAAELNTLDGVTATTTELNYTDGVTSNIQTQLDSMVEKAGDTMTGDLSLGDGVKAKFGASNDLQIYHDGLNSWIQDVGAGSLILKSDGTYTSIQNSVGNDQVLVSSTDVKLANSGNTKLATTSTGVDVTGTITADGLTSDGGIVSTGSFATVQARKDGGDTFGAGATLGLANAAANRIWFNQLSTSNNYDYWYFDGATPRKRATIANNGDVSFYEDTGTTAKFVWDASAESLDLNGTTTVLNVKSPTQSIGGGNSQVKIGSTDTAAAGKGGQLNFTANTVSIANYPVAGVHGYHETAGAGNYSGYLSMYTTSSGGGVTERMRIDSAGNVGIGTASPDHTLRVNGDGRVGNLHIKTSEYTAGTGKAIWADTAGTGVLGLNSSTALQFNTNNTERARIDSLGNLLVGKTALDINVIGHQFLSDASGDYAAHTSQDTRALLLNRKVSDGEIVDFRKNGAAVGSIGVTGSTTSYNTSSDERLKENIQNTTHTVDINDIRVREFDWKAGGEHQRFGFIAQELETVYPEAVHSPEDPKEMKSVDYSKLVPLLVKEIQTLKARIEELEK